MADQDQAAQDQAAAQPMADQDQAAQDQAAAQPKADQDQEAAQPMAEQDQVAVAAARPAAKQDKIAVAQKHTLSTASQFRLSPTVPTVDDLIERGASAGFAAKYREQMIESGASMSLLAKHMEDRLKMLANTVCGFVQTETQEVRNSNEEIKADVRQMKKDIEGMLAAGKESIENKVNETLNQHRGDSNLSAIQAELLSPNNVAIAQFLEYVLQWGPDTPGASGIMPPFYFTMAPNCLDTGPDNSIVVISKAFMYFISGMSDQYSVKVKSGFMDMVDTTMVSFFNCLHTLDKTQKTQLEQRFPFVPYDRNGVFVCPTSHFASCLVALSKLKPCQRYVRQGVKLKYNDVHAPVEGGLLDPSKNIKRKLRPMLPEQAKKWLQSSHGKNTEKERLWNVLCQTLPFKRGYPKEALSQKAFYIGVKIVRDAFGLKTPAYNKNKPWHVGSGFNIQHEAPVRPFEDIMNEACGYEDESYKDKFFGRPKRKQVEASDDEELGKKKCKSSKSKNKSRKKKRPKKRPRKNYDEQESDDSSHVQFKFTHNSDTESESESDA
jgi:hypothetical protein